MNRIRNIIYNISDILVTLLIVAVALLLISWRVSAIMDYGSVKDEVEQEVQGSIVDNGIVEDEDVTQQEASADSYSFSVGDSQSAESIAQSLVDMDLVSDKQTFLNAVVNADAEKRLRSGTFTIPAGSTPEQIVAILTNSSN
jgi:hypothetical protein